MQISQVLFQDKEKSLKVVRNYVIEMSKNCFSTFLVINLARVDVKKTGMFAAWKFEPDARFNPDYDIKIRYKMTSDTGYSTFSSDGRRLKATKVQPQRIDRQNDFICPQFPLLSGGAVSSFVNIST